MKRSIFIFFIFFTIAVLLSLAPSAEAYPTYQSAEDVGDNCSECHPGFVGGFGSALHELHVGSTRMTNTCTLCHDSPGSTPVYTSTSPTQNNNLGCAGCHEQFGLRLHHTNAGAPADSSGLTCVDCHTDDPPPPAENIVDVNVRAYYLRDDVNVKEPCNSDGSEDWDGDTFGLDNDGDLFYDGNDPDCQAGVCGDGNVDAGEECDAGVENGTTVCGCQVDCTLPPAGTDCSDADFCNGAETCDGAGTCQAGTPVDCFDSVGCTDDFCDEASDSCVNAPNDANCPDDGNFCNGTEFCDALADCSSTGDPCPAGTVCNEDTDICEPVGCTIDADCDDGLFCNGIETCNVTTGECMPGLTCPVAIDGCVILGGACDEENDVCLDVADDSLCDDGLFCNGAETCDINTHGCLAGSDPCPAGTTCIEDTDICEPVGCTIDADCDDGLFCNGAETCDISTGLCGPGSDPCPTGTVCNEGTDTCDVVMGKVTICHIPPGNPSKAKTLSIDSFSVEEHLAHGDTLGPCP
jgi:hypothetical protein